MQFDDLINEQLDNRLSSDGWAQTIKWANFVNLSTTTNIVSLPPDFGRLSTKSMEMKDQATSGIGSGDKSPGYWQVFDFDLWQTGHSATKVSTDFFIWGQWNILWILWWVARMPEWPPMAEECIEDNILILRSVFVPMQTLPLYLSMPKWTE
jgi:hypothetical protein